MMNPHAWLYTIASVAVVSLISLVGVFTLSMREERLKKLLLVFVSFAVGALYGDAFIHLLPETYRQFGMGLVPSLFVMGGILLFFLIEKTIRWSQTVVASPTAGVHPMVPLILLVDGVHNFIDGMVIGASFSVSVPIGVTTSLAVIFHEIPHEVGDFAILVHGGLPVRRALLFNFLSALTAILGGALSLLLGPVVREFPVVILPLTAGGFIYIAGSDLIPELQQTVRFKGTAWQFAAMALGIGVMALLLLLGR